MEDKITELIYLLRQAKTEAEDLKANIDPRSVGEIDAYFVCSDIEKAISHLNMLKVLIG